MNPFLIAEAFRSVVESDPDFAALSKVNAENNADNPEYPRVVFGCRFRGLAKSSAVGTATVSITVETHGGDNGAAVHSDRVELVRRKFFGNVDGDSMTVRAALAAQISATTQVDVDPRYVPIGDIEPERRGDLFRTTLRLMAGVHLRPV